MSKMRTTARIIICVMLACLGMVAGCRKTDLKDRSVMTIAGNTFGVKDLNMTYEVGEGNFSGPLATMCKDETFVTTIVFTLEPVALLTVRLMQPSNDEPVPEGTYSVVSTDCVRGVTVFFTTGSGKKAVYNLEVSSGTMKVRDDDGTYDIDIDFAFSPMSGGGTIKGNFTGTMGQAQGR